MEREPIDEAEKHVSWYAKIRTKLATRAIKEERDKEFGDYITDEVIEEANYWADDFELSKGCERGDIVKNRYVKRGKKVEMEEVEQENPFLKYRR